MTPISTNRILSIMASVAGTVLTISAVGKIFNLPLFATLLSGIFPFSATMSFVFAILIFALESAVGLTLIFYPGSITGKALGAIMFLSFALTQAFIIAMNINTECGCFGLFQGELLTRILTNHWFMLMCDIFFGIMLCINCPFFTRRSFVN
jgi:hypothetical protein